MASEISQLAFDIITKREQSKKDCVNRATGEFKEAIISTYQKNPFTLDKLKDMIRKRPKMKELYLYGHKGNYGTCAIGFGEWEQIHSDIYWTNCVEYEDREKMDKEGCLAVKRFFDKANKENKWNFKTHNDCYGKEPKFWISW